jgi:enolase
MTHARISEVRARRVWDSRGRPTLEVEIDCDDGTRGRGIAPAGASTGSREALDLRDGGERLGGMDVLTAIEKVGRIVAPALVGTSLSSRSAVDEVLDRLDETTNRSGLGGNVTTAVSLAALVAGARVRRIPAFELLGGQPSSLPRPEVQVVGGGAHALGTTFVQDFMVVPLTATTAAGALEQVAEIYHAVGRRIVKLVGPAGVADEGGHWPGELRPEAILELMTLAIGDTGLIPGVEVGISLDLAATQFSTEDGRYHVGKQIFSGDEWLEVLSEWVSDYPVVAMEDVAHEADSATADRATARFRKTCLLIGDDALVTSAALIRESQRLHQYSAALIKVNQAGTVAAAEAAVNEARQHGMPIVVSARSGETEDAVLVDLAVGWSADLIKVGSITRGERTAKWNRLVRIADRYTDLKLVGWPIP